MVGVIKSDIQRETAQYKKDLGWADTPTFTNVSDEQDYQISFEEMIENEGFFSLDQLSNKKVRKSAPGMKQQESTYKKIATMPTPQASGQKQISEDIFDFDVQGNNGEAIEIDSTEIEQDYDDGKLRMPLIVIEKSASILAEQKAKNTAIVKQSSVESLDKPIGKKNSSNSPNEVAKSAQLMFSSNILTPLGQKPTRSEESSQQSEQQSLAQKNLASKKGNSLKARAQRR